MQAYYYVDVCKLFILFHFPLQVHRRTLYDDRRGVGEPINETGLTGDGLIIRGRHFALLDNLTNSTMAHRVMGEALMLKPYVTFARDKSTYEEWSKKYPTKVSCMYTVV